MGLLQKLFGRNFKRSNEPDKENTAQLQKNSIRFVQVNAEDGDTEYQFQYGVMFFTGCGPGGGAFTKDATQSIYWLSKSAEQGNLNAVAMLGRVYMENGDAATAVKYYRMAAEKNHEAACENLALAYGMGDGVPEDQLEAHRWFLKAAELGSAYSQYIVGKHYFDGVYVEENSEEAFKWFFRSAEQGQPNAQFEIGQLYEYGGKDLKTAREWYAKAAAQGHEAAKEKL